MRKAPKSHDHLTMTTNEGTIELTERELTRVTGGLKLDDIKFVDSNHKVDIGVLRSAATDPNSGARADIPGPPLRANIGSAGHQLMCF